jgi:hypothetical protein
VSSCELVVSRVAIGGFASARAGASETRELMRLPNGNRAVVAPAKVRDYLLARRHPVGGLKTPFFEALGFQRGRWQQLATLLRELAADGDAVLREVDRFGRKYEISATLTGPAERNAHVVTIWIVPAGDDRPRFVTAHPSSQP